uniref:3-hydroxyisobutyryl-CoA hydrolase n=1 Tax=Cannabis sativa TaxID=3483 RepID=A0A803PSN5_CANSA
MQRLKKAASLLRQNLHCYGFHTHHRALSSVPHSASADVLDSQVLVEGKPWSRTAILNRPSALNALTAVMVAILNGITMGGGAGVSIPGMFRLATEKTRVPLIEEQLGNLVTDDPSVIETTLENYGELIHPDSENGVLSRIEVVDKCFSHDTVEEIIDAMENEAARTKDAWCISTAKRLKEVSPLSLKVSLRSIREGRFQTLDQCLIREYRMSLQGVSKQISGDFTEGVRAKVVEKDLAPKWDPPTLGQVTQDMVDRYFSPLSEFDADLELPTNLREAFT